MLELNPTLLPLLIDHISKVREVLELSEEGSPDRLRAGLIGEAARLLTLASLEDKEMLRLLPRSARMN